MRQHFELIVLFSLWNASLATASDHPVFDRQKERDERLSHFTLELEQYGIIRKDFYLERMKEQFAAAKMGGSKMEDSEDMEALPPVDADGFTTASFRFALKIDALGQPTHVHRRILPQDHLPFAFPRLPNEIRFTNATGLEEGLTRVDGSTYSGYTVVPDAGVINFRRTILEWCCGFGLTRYATKEGPVQEKDLGNGLTECQGAMNLPFIGSGKYHAEIDAKDIVRSVIFLKETFSRDTVIHTVTTTGEYQVGKDVVADKGNFARELPFQPVNGQEALRTETDDGYTTKLISMTTDLDADGFARNSRIKEIPATAFVVDMTHGKAKIPPRAGAASTPTPSSKSRFWWFTLNLAAIAGFIVYLWRKRSRSNPPLAGEFT